MLNIPIVVQDALREGTMRKNYKMKVNDVDPDTGERTYSYTIENDELVSESVKIDERMVTGKNLKFGLCEGSVLEFQYFNHPNINGKDVQVYLSAEYVDTDDVVKWYDIPMGWYSVDQCPMQWDTGIFKVTAYNKLKSKYLDAKANQLLIQQYGDHSYYLFDVLNGLLADYKIDQDNKEEVTPNIDESIIDTTSTFGFTNLFGDQFVFSPSAYVRTAGTSSFYFRVYHKRLKLTHELNISIRDIIKVSCDIDMDELASHLQNEIKNKFQSLYTNKTTAQLESIFDEAYNFYINVTYMDDSSRSYGIVRGIESNYSFADFFKDSYTNIKTLTFYYPYLVLMLGTPSPTSAYRPSMYLSGNTHEYDYYESGDWSTLYTGTYSSPRYPNGDMIVDASDIGTKVNFYKLTDVSDIERMRVDTNTFPDVTLRELQSAVFETVCQYGQVDRETDMFAGVELNSGGLYPADTLYPDNALYPSGPSLHPFPSTYQKLWTDTVGEQSFRYLIITYKAIENGEEVEKTLQRTVNTYGTTNYNMSDNWLFRNLVWTAADVGAYADAMVLKMKDVKWFPFELWCAGLPYIETGDAIEITDKQGNTHTSYVLTRTLDGIQNLQDTFVNGELDIF